eukprot:364340-Chlamydomonas_euryale.AAC.9
MACALPAIWLATQAGPQAAQSAQQSQCSEVLDLRTPSCPGLAPLGPGSDIGGGAIPHIHRGKVPPPPLS